MVKDWLFGKVKERALVIGGREVEKFVAGLQAMEDKDIGTVLAIATVIRINFETYTIIPRDLFFENALPSVEVMGLCQIKINKMARKFTRMGRPVDSMGAMVWSYSLRCLNVPGLRPLGRRMWSELIRGFPYVEEALEVGADEKNEPFPKRVWEEWKAIPVGLEPE